MKQFEDLKSQDEIDWEDNRKSLRMWVIMFGTTILFYLLLFAALIKYVFFG